MYTYVVLKKMHFYNLLKAGVSFKIVALEVVEELIEKTSQDRQLFIDFACDLINDILVAIGIDCVITQEQILDCDIFTWPMEQLQIYAFHYVPWEFEKVEKFLLEFCRLMQMEHRKFIESLDYYVEENEEIDYPLEYLMQIVDIWCIVYKQLQHIEDLQINKRFEEPIARISFHFLMGLHEPRMLYRTDFAIADMLCTRLLQSALPGLYYIQSHDMIFDGLIDIFRRDFYVFPNNDIDGNFFFDAFAVEIKYNTPLILYRTLKEMLMDIQDDTQLNTLLNILLEQDMLEVYFSTIMEKRWNVFKNLKKNNFVKIQREALKFLDVLQSKLISLDCFTREFIESVLKLVFTLDPSTSVLACNLYVKIMQRKFSTEIVLKHMMDFYVTHIGSVANLKSYILNVYESLNCLLNFDNFLALTTDASCSEIIKLFSAHIVVTVFEIKFKQNDTLEELQHLLQILPDIFVNLHLQKCIGILLQVYAYIPIDKLKKPILDNFIHYTVGVFTDIDKNLEYPVLMNIFGTFHNILMQNRKWNILEEFAEHLLRKYREMIREFKTREQRQEQNEEFLDENSLFYYNNLMKRLDIILKTNYDIVDDNYLDYIDNLLRYLIYHKKIAALIVKHNLLMDMYALEIVILLLIKLVHTNTTNKESLAVSPHVQGLLKYLWSHFENIDQISRLSVFKIKTYFCCLLKLYIHLPLKLGTQDYHKLIQLLIAVNFRNKAFHREPRDGELQHSHPQMSLEYKRLMLRKFTIMHECPNVQITTNSVWKLCIYYKLFKHPFDDELKNLITTLANKRLNIYKKIVAVLIYNLYKQSPALKTYTIMTIIKEHKHLIDNLIEIESPALLKVHVVLMVLQILEKALTAQRINTNRNRIEALKHLNIFIEDLNLSQWQAKQLIKNQLRVCGQHLLTAGERRVLDNFKNLL